MKKKYLLFFIILVITSGFILYTTQVKEEVCVWKEVNLKKEQVNFYWKDTNNKEFKSIGNLKNWLEKKNQKAIFITNGGMYKKDNSPQGLYIENFIVKSTLDTLNGNGNFYLKPNGIFHIDSHKKASICTTSDYKPNSSIEYATQSGPMLVIDNKLHNAFNKESKNLNIRNGVGILENGNILFAMSKIPINFYDFASFFKEKGCKNALYLDGFVSRTYFPEKNYYQTDGDFGILIAITKK